MKTGAVYQNTLRCTEISRPDVLTLCSHSRYCHCLRADATGKLVFIVKNTKVFDMRTKRHSVLVPLFQPKLRRVNFYIRGQQLNYIHLNMNKTQDKSVIQRETSLSCYYL